ncbi:MAG: hypothetical protein U0R52_09830 [Solirubrobacterales bacterium]
MTERHHGTDGPPDQGRPEVTRLAERIAAIIDAAERSAEAILEDAEREARAYMDEVRRRTDTEVERRIAALVELSETLGARAEDLRAEAERLGGALGGLGPAGPGEDVSSEASAVRLPSRPRRGQPRPDSPAVKMLVAQMAASGSDRKEIEERLRSGFGMEDSKDLLDEVLEAGEPGRRKPARRWRRPWRTIGAG